MGTMRTDKHEFYNIGFTLAQNQKNELRIFLNATVVLNLAVLCDITYFLQWTADCRGCFHKARNKILFCHETNSVHISFYCGKKIKWTCFFVPIFWSTIFVSFRIVSFLESVYITFITRNEIAFLSEWPQWNDTHNEFHFVVFRVSSLKRLIRHQIENSSFRPKWNIM